MAHIRTAPWSACLTIGPVFAACLLLGGCRGDALRGLDGTELKDSDGAELNRFDVYAQMDDLFRAKSAELRTREDELKGLLSYLQAQRKTRKPLQIDPGIQTGLGVAAHDEESEGERSEAQQRRAIAKLESETERVSGGLLHPTFRRDGRKRYGDGYDDVDELLRTMHTAYEDATPGAFVRAYYRCFPDNGYNDDGDERTGPERPLRLRRPACSELAGMLTESFLRNWQAGLADRLATVATDVDGRLKGVREELELLKRRKSKIGAALGKDSSLESLVRWSIPALFVVVVIVAGFGLGFPWFQGDEADRRRTTLRLLTVVLLVTAILVLGLSGTLHSEILGTLLAGISVHVLSRPRDEEAKLEAAPNVTPPGGQPATPPGFVLENRAAGFGFRLRDNQGAVLMTSPDFADKAAVTAGVAAVREGAMNSAGFETRRAPSGQNYVVLNDGANQVLATSELFRSVSSAEALVDQVHRVAPSAPVSDQT